MESNYKKYDSGRAVSTWFTHDEVEIMDNIVKTRKMTDPKFTRSKLIKEVLSEKLINEKSVNLVKLSKNPLFDDLLISSSSFRESFNEQLINSMPDSFTDEESDYYGSLFLEQINEEKEMYLCSRQDEEQIF